MLSTYISFAQELQIHVDLAYKVCFVDTMKFRVMWNVAKRPKQQARVAAMVLDSLELSPQLWYELPWFLKLPTTEVI